MWQSYYLFYNSYYIHLWLDNYFDENIKKLFLSKYNVQTFESTMIINENMKNLDIKSLMGFISKITIIDSSFIDFLPININKSIRIFKDFKYKCLNKNFNTTCPIILNEDDYIDFINNCSDIFLNEYNFRQLI